VSRAGAAVALLVFARAAAAQTIVLSDGTREVPVDLARLPRARLALRDPTDGGRAKTLLGPRLADALAALPPPDGADAIAVRCDDGWLSLIPIPFVHRYSSAVLAIAEGTRAHPIGAPRGPVYLAFPTEAASDRAGDAPLADNGWAWAVASIEYVRLAAVRAKLDLPRGAPALAAQGRQLFERRCLHCHAIRGAGGLAGWDLAQPNVLRYRDEQRVRGYVLDPRRYLREARMPSFAGKLAPSDIDALVAYLRALVPTRR